MGRIAGEEGLRKRLKNLACLVALNRQVNAAAALS
jgi:hypothetical protein